MVETKIRLHEGVLNEDPVILELVEWDRVSAQISKFTPIDVRMRCPVELPRPDIPMLSEGDERSV